MSAVVQLQCKACGWWWYFSDQHPASPFTCKCCLEGRPLWDDVIECPPSSIRLKAVPEKK